MSINAEQVEYVANLARIELSVEEKILFTKQLHSILDYIAKLNLLDTSAASPTSHVLPLQNVYRADARKESLPKELALANAPESDGKHYLVPKVI